MGDMSYCVGIEQGVRHNNWVCWNANQTVEQQKEINEWACLVVHLVVVF